MKVWKYYRGVLLLLIGLKFPVARRYFFAGFKGSTARSMAERVYKALVVMVERFRDMASYTVLREEIDCIKGPLRVHGMCIYMRRLGIVKPTTACSGIRLGVDKQLFRIQPFTASVRGRIECFLGMSKVLDGLPVVWSVKAYNANQSIVLQKLTALQVCRLSGVVRRFQYNRQWTFCQYQLSECRINKDQRLSYSQEDTVSMLPGPDVKNVRKRLGMERPLKDLYENQGFSYQPEYICMTGCLHTGRFKERRVSGGDAKRRVSVSGRCSRCVAGHRTRYYCRVRMHHVAAAAPRPVRS